MIYQIIEVLFFLECMRMTLKFPYAPAIPDLESQINNRQNRVYAYCLEAET